MLCMLEAVEGKIGLLEVLGVLYVPEVMRCILLCTLEAVEEERCLLKVLEILEILEVVEVPDVPRCVLLCMLEAVESGLWAQFWGSRNFHCGSFLRSLVSNSPPLASGRNTIIAEMSSHKLNPQQQSLAQAQYDDMVCCSFPSVVMRLSLTTIRVFAIVRLETTRFGINGR